MNPDFSERQFETAVNIELTNSLRPHMSPATPIVPTTNQEAEAGWDALFKLGTGYWYFLQYKVAVRASRRTHWNTGFWAVHRGPYLRFLLHSDSNGECRQHRLLTELRQAQSGVYYCVPSFVKEEELWTRIATNSVFEGCRLIDLAGVALPNYHGRHQISFDDSGFVQVWSAPGEGSISERSPAIRRDQTNRREISREAVAGLLLDATRIVARSTRTRRGRQAFETWIDARLPERVRSSLREISQATEQEDLAPGVAGLLPAGELVATTSRILQLDFGLTWVVEPG
ncbi:MAG TPA: hypothetical protein VGO24_07855 [Solirubrobacterales bacterium]|nr:hypothetical protein [Solirubrobacterales bacterium]